MYPVSQVFDWDKWQDGFDDHWRGDQNESVREEFRTFKRQVLENFKYYRVPVITLDRQLQRRPSASSSKRSTLAARRSMLLSLSPRCMPPQAMNCEKIGMAMTVPKDVIAAWPRLSGLPGLIPVSSLACQQHRFSAGDFALSYPRPAARGREGGKQGKELPAVSGNRQALLNLPLEAYKRYEAQVERGFVQAAKFLHMLHIYRIFDLPYQSQIVPLAAILADIGDAWEHEANRAKLVRWYWNGVFGELYGSAVETRIARDFMEVPAWLKGGPEPSTVSETMFRADRLKTMRMRLSAAYKGVNALLMKEGAQDFRSGQKFDQRFFSARMSTSITSSRRTGARNTVSSRTSTIPSSTRHPSPTEPTELSVATRHRNTSPAWKGATRKHRRLSPTGSMAISNLT